MPAAPAPSTISFCRSINSSTALSSWRSPTRRTAPTSAATMRRVSSPGSLTAMPSARVVASAGRPGSLAAQQPVHRGIERRLHADDLDVRATAPWPRRRCRRSARRRRSARSACRVRAVGEHFERDRALSRDDRRIVIGVDEGKAALAGEGVGGRAARRRGFRREHHLGAERLGAVDLGERRALPASRSSPGCRAGGRDRRRPGRGCRPTSRRPRRGARPGSRVSSLLSAPRSLNEPVGCSVSSFKNTSHPANSESEAAADRAGCAPPRRRSPPAARRISAIVTGRSFIARVPESRVARPAAARPGTSQSKSRQRCNRSAKCGDSGLPDWPGTAIIRDSAGAARSVMMRSPAPKRCA